MPMLSPQEAIIAIMRASHEGGLKHGIEGGLLRGAPSHTGAHLLNALAERGIVLAKMEPTDGR